MKKQIMSLVLIALCSSPFTSLQALNPSAAFKKAKDVVMSYAPTPTNISNVYQKHPRAVQALSAVIIVTAVGALAYKYCPKVKSTVNKMFDLDAKPKPGIKRACSSCGACNKPKPSQSSCASGSCSVKTTENPQQNAEEKTQEVASACN